MKDNTAAIKTFSDFEEDIVSETRSTRWKVISTVEAYEAFKRLKATPTELAALFSSKCYGIDYRGCNKSMLARDYLANENRLRENLPFSELVEKYGFK